LIMGVHTGKFSSVLFDDDISMDGSLNRLDNEFSKTSVGSIRYEKVPTCCTIILFFIIFDNV
jgi:hypothetical protein